LGVDAPLVAAEAGNERGASSLGVAASLAPLKGVFDGDGCSMGVGACLVAAEGDERGALSLGAGEPMAPLKVVKVAFDGDAPCVGVANAVVAAEESVERGAGCMGVAISLAPLKVVDGRGACAMGIASKLAPAVTERGAAAMGVATFVAPLKVVVVPDGDVPGEGVFDGDDPSMGVAASLVAVETDERGAGGMGVAGYPAPLKGEVIFDDNALTVGVGFSMVAVEADDERGATALGVGSSVASLKVVVRHWSRMLSTVAKGSVLTSAWPRSLRLRFSYRVAWA
jgi:hypothetical protein